MNEKYISDTIKKIREDSKLTQKQFGKMVKTFLILIY